MIARDVEVLMIGAGGLGCPALLALASRGVRKIIVLEPDRVELSNLHRQILYAEADVGKPKAEIVQLFFREHFPAIEIDVVREAFSIETHAFLERVHVVLDGTDAFETKLAISDACVDRCVPYVFAGVVAHDGQVLAVRPGRSACVRCLFDEAPPPGAAPTCSEVGIFGPHAGRVAAEQVRRALCLAAGDDGEIVDRLWIYDGLRDVSRSIALARAADCKGCGANQSLRGARESLEQAPDSIMAPILDLSGRACPDTYTLTRRALETIPEHGRLWVHLTSDEAVRNLPKSAIAAGHHLLAVRSDGARHRILLERGAETRAVLHNDSHRNETI